MDPAILSYLSALGPWGVVGALGLYAGLTFLRRRAAASQPAAPAPVPAPGPVSPLTPADPGTSSHPILQHVLDAILALRGHPAGSMAPTDLSIEHLLPLRAEVNALVGDKVAQHRDVLGIDPPTVATAK